ncbi:LCP family protein [Gorillibacterium massiliense]|uniref:LCP family protein n=1 Tax=Gorillibacterium massiliense TaxID=1280390 RepID=UPI0004B5EE33|nr:LCP family protein [Gorillibacterium massiliense]
MRKTVKWLGLTILFIAIIFIGKYAYDMYHSLDGLHKGEKAINIPKNKASEISAEEPPKWEGKERVNILLMGADSRGAENGDIPRSDTLMIVSVDPVTKKATLFSILRDTWVKIPGHGEDRINAAFAYGGSNLAVQTVSNFTGLEIQYYVYTDFLGFIALVDEIGGIDLDVEKDMNYEDAWDQHKFDIHLKKGYQHLDGEKALQYVRFRHDASSDFTRTERQRKFIMAVADKVKSTSNLLKLPKIISSVDPYIDTNLTVSNMIKLGALGFQVKNNGVDGQQLPPQDLLKEARIGGAQVLTANSDEVKAFIQDTLEKQVAPDPTTAPTTNPNSVSMKDDGTKKEAESAH